MYPRFESQLPQPIKPIPLKREWALLAGAVGFEESNFVRGILEEKLKFLGLLQRVQQRTMNKTINDL